MQHRRFDPFSDFETAGYLRNVEGLTDPEEIRIQEHAFFEANLDEAVAFLKRCGPITYADFCEVHRILFQDFYPWAGQDRHTLGVARIIEKGPRVQFEVSEESQRAIDHGLRCGNDPGRMRARPGEVMGLFAWGHAFLDGNGRTMLLVHTELCARAGFSIDWRASRKNAYLEALTLELAHPANRALDRYFAPLMREHEPGSDWLAHIEALPGLDGGSTETDSANLDGDAEARIRYEDFKQARGYNIPD